MWGKNPGVIGKWGHQVVLGQAALREPVLPGECVDVISNVAGTAICLWWRMWEGFVCARVHMCVHVCTCMHVSVCVCL